MILIRRANLADATAIIDFQLKMAWETEKRSLERDILQKGVYAVFSDNRKGEYYVAEAYGKVVASLLITYEWSDWRNCDVWWLQSVFVMPKYRRKGIFRKMYTFIKEKATAYDIAGLRLYVETGNKRAMKTYEALGMSSEHYNFYEWMRK